MIEFGKTLRAAREAKGYSISQVAEMTHLLSAVIDGLEREDFTHIPAPIYGRGFVRLYCEAVGLDAKPLVALFMAKMTGAVPEPVTPPPAAAPVVDEPPPPTPAAPEPEPEQPVVPSAPVLPEPREAEPPPRAFHLPPRQAQPDLFNPEPPPPLPTQAPQPAEPPQTENEAPQESHATLSRYSVPLKTEPSFHLPSISIPPRVWRLGALGLGGLAVLVLLGFGLRALYRATTEPADTRPTAEDTIEQTSVATAQPSAPAPAATVPAAEKTALPPSAPRQVQKIPPLYFD